MKRKQLILSLIKDDLINSKLVDALNSAGLCAGCYSLHLGETVFALMGFAENSQSEMLFEHYIRMCRKAQHINISENNQGLDALTHEIFADLKRAGS